eukprot:scaffold2808_cov255-Pinguiococcus_pyrenoidosus.AAC.32
MAGQQASLRPRGIARAMQRKEQVPTKVRQHAFPDHRAVDQRTQYEAMLRRSDPHLARKA